MRAVFHFVNPRQADNQAMLVAFTRMTHCYRLYGADDDLALARMKLGWTGPSTTLRRTSCTLCGASR